MLLLALLASANPVLYHIEHYWQLNQNHIRNIHAFYFFVVHYHTFNFLRFIAVVYDAREMQAVSS